MDSNATVDPRIQVGFEHVFEEQPKTIYRFLQRLNSKNWTVPRMKLTSSKLS